MSTDNEVENLLITKPQDYILGPLTFNKESLLKIALDKNNLDLAWFVITLTPLIMIFSLGRYDRIIILIESPAGATAVDEFVFYYFMLISNFFLVPLITKKGIELRGRQNFSLLPILRVYIFSNIWIFFTYLIMIFVDQNLIIIGVLYLSYFCMVISSSIGIASYLSYPKLETFVIVLFAHGGPLLLEFMVWEFVSFLITIFGGLVVVVLVILNLGKLVHSSLFRDN